ncbi:FecR family protein [Chitinophaga sp. XS-30]|uniref:FecR family protein n=1 Tax=Chitinophaga sp. XS-30 TaxID=2604421 RepID=UPI0011DC8ECA|nr:FecR family protein [Chitinophaga sp. XS-30]QEH42164.1 FecR family protein [Chitinophaga sp. XS-30]
MKSSHRKSWKILLRKYLSGKSTGVEKRFLEEYYDAFGHRENILDGRSREEKDLLAQSMKQHILRQAGITPATVTVPLFRRTWFRAASILVLLGSAACMYLLWSPRKQQHKSLADLGAPAGSILPGGKKAYLTLADGRRIALDDAAKGRLTSQGQTLIVKEEEGQLRYEGLNGDDKVYFNTISTPRGGEYKVVLPDGSAVWLNAESSIRFPTQFKGNERRVELTGEAYFEVAKAGGHQPMPFIASVNGMEVTVLGTHFNIKAYQNEATIRTTLLEGAVKVSRHAASDQAVILRPGQQAAVTGDQQISVKAVDVEEQVAWKNGRFDFRSEQISAVMKQLERWYNVDVVYESMPSVHFSGTISRKADVKGVLKTLEMTGGAHFRIEGRKIIVQQ